MTEENKQALIEHAKSWIADSEALRDEIPFGFDGDTEKEVSLIRIALAALTAQPVDWKLVPVEPTRQMMAQGHFAMAGTDRGKFRRIYQAMVAAAPTLP